MASVLVAYATKYGSTKEVAEAIAKALGERGVDAVVRPAGEVRDLKGYSAVVLGTALYFFRWRGEAHRFISRNRSALSGVPVAVFGLGPIEDTPEQFEAARQHLDKGLAKHRWLALSSVAIFGGRLDPAHLRFPDNNPAFRRMAPSDTRDWDAVRSWAQGLIGALGLKSGSEA
ncbi:MAG: flavodoxin domain-containing protein [Coriobacteriia bacterium]|nr:flavodoxin domain-containing protein [Coriobacteriia bacterium]